MRWARALLRCDAPCPLELLEPVVDVNRPLARGSGLAGFDAFAEGTQVEQADVVLLVRQVGAQISVSVVGAACANAVECPTANALNADAMVSVTWALTLVMNPSNE
jgi:hypothetical protein